MEEILTIVVLTHTTIVHHIVTQKSYVGGLTGQQMFNGTHVDFMNKIKFLVLDWEQIGNGALVQVIDANNINVKYNFPTTFGVECFQTNMRKPQVNSF